MAKKVVASLKKTDGKSFAKVIRAVRSEKTGAYTFREEIMPAEMKLWPGNNPPNLQKTQSPHVGLFLFPDYYPISAFKNQVHVHSRQPVFKRKKGNAQ